jgi:hypothetical protein
MTLAKDTYESVLAMLNSSDEENKVMGFQCLKNAKLTPDNMVYILFLLRESDVNLMWWKREVPDIIESLESIFSCGLEHKTFSFGEILRVMKQYKLTIDDYKFYMRKYSQEMRLNFNLDNVSGPFNIEIKITQNES